MSDFLTNNLYYAKKLQYMIYNLLLISMLSTYTKDNR